MFSPKQTNKQKVKIRGAKYINCVHGRLAYTIYISSHHTIYFKYIIILLVIHPSIRLVKKTVSY